MSIIKYLKSLSFRPKSEYVIDFFLSLLFILLYFESTKEWKYSKLEDLTNFNAYTPFQYRILLPLLANLAKKVIPGVNYVFLYQIFLLGFTLLLSYYTRLFIKLYFRDQFSVNVGVIVLFYILFWNYPALGIWLHPADIPAILFFLLGLIFIQKNNFLKYYPLFVLACFNRESIILILFAYIMSRKNLKEILLNLHILILYLITWGAIKFLLYSIFQNNPAEVPAGSLFLLKFNENLDFLWGLMKLDKFYFLRIFAFGGIYLFIYNVFDRLDITYKKLLLTVPVYLIIILFVGKFQEIRVFSELVPLFIIPGILLVKSKLLI